MNKEKGNTALYIIIALLVLALGFAIWEGAREEGEGTDEEEEVREEVNEEEPQIMDPDIERTQ